MPLPPASPREELHCRRIDMRGYRRADGLYDVEARLIDTKSEGMETGGGQWVPAGEAIHDMAIRLVVDEDLLVIDVMASTDAAPYDICPQATATLQTIKGLRIGAGWSKAIRGRLAGRLGCTHLTELLSPLATTAFQSLWTVRVHRPDVLDTQGKPVKIDSCYAYASDRDIVRERWPMHHDGDPAHVR